MEQIACCFADHFIIKNFWIATGQFPSLEKWRPVDVGADLCQRVVAERLHTDKAGLGRRIVGPIGFQAMRARVCQFVTCTLRFFVGMQFARLGIVGLYASYITVVQSAAQQVVAHPHRT